MEVSHVHTVAAVHIVFSKVSHSRIVECNSVHDWTDLVRPDACIAQTGSTLATLARALQDEDRQGGATAAQDAREEEQLPLEMRIKGATELFNKTKSANLAGWTSMVIFSKREAMYGTMKLENSDESSILVSDK